jgi:protein gp37
LKWNREAEREGLPRRVFCASLADVFDNQVPAEWRRDLWLLISATPHLDWLLLTKRPQNITKMLPRMASVPGLMWPWPNVWLGTTVENQEEADRRIQHLLAVPAARRFLSCEPLLGPVDLRGWLYHFGTERTGGVRPRSDLHWVICGGESGPGARPMHPDWARSLRDQCKAAGVAFFMKQMGGVRDKRGNLEEIPEDLRVRQFPNGS